MKVGILAVQGDFEAHAATLARVGVDYVFARTPRDLDGVDAVILPGGESTTQWKFLVEEGLDKSLLEHAANGGAIFGTCAGAILLAILRDDSAATLSLCTLYMRNPIAHKSASAQKVASVRLIARRLKTVEKLFMTICEKLFSAQQSQRFSLTSQRRI